MGFDAAENVRTRVDDYRQGAWRVVTPGYFQSLQIPLVRGRLFTTADVYPAPRAVIVNETMARLAWPNGEDPIGRGLALGNGSTMTVVGVVGDTRHVVLDSLPGPTMYYAHGQFPWPTMWLIVRTSGEPNLAAAAVAREVAALDATIPLANVRPLAEFVSDTSAEPRLTMLIFAIFATSALVLAAVGLYGIVAYSVSQRTREIGVSIALGAQPERIVRGVLGHGMRLALGGVVLGAVAAYAGAGLLRSILYATQPTDATTYLLVGALLLLVAAAASAVPARRASRLDPMQALRSE
jgi:predicted permease